MRNTKYLYFAVCALFLFTAYNCSGKGWYEGVKSFFARPYNWLQSKLTSPVFASAEQYDRNDRYIPGLELLSQEEIVALENELGSIGKKYEMMETYFKAMVMDKLGRGYSVETCTNFLRAVEQGTFDEV